MIKDTYIKNNILIIHKSQFFEKGLKPALEQEPGFRVTELVYNGDFLSHLYQYYMPDVVLINAEVSEEKNMDSISVLTSRFPQIKVLILTTEYDFSYVSKAIKYGVSGYLLKEMDEKSIINAIKEVNRGGLYLHPRVTNDFINEYSKLKKTKKTMYNLDFKQTIIQQAFQYYTIFNSKESQLVQENVSTAVNVENFDRVIKGQSAVKINGTKRKERPCTTLNLRIVPKIKVVIIESQSVIRKGLRRVIELDTNIQVVAEGTHHDQMLSLFTQYHPDVLILEMTPEIDEGTLEKLFYHFPFAKVIFLTEIDDLTYVYSAVKNGVSGYLLQSVDAESITYAIKAVSKGGIYLDPTLAKGFLDEFRSLLLTEEQYEISQRRINHPNRLLTRREREVLQLMVDGNSNKSLGEKLKISELTVKNHVSSIIKKLNLQDRTQVVVAAIKNGWAELR